jgi:hypothetical protein
MTTPAPPTPLNPSGAIDLQAVLFGDKPAPAPQVSAPATPAMPPSPEPAPIVLPSLDDIKPSAPVTPAATHAPAPDETYGALADTFHSQDTIGLTDQTKAVTDDSLRLDGTVGFGPSSKAPIDPALDVTKTASNNTPPPQESFYGEAPKSGSQIDERSEKMFKEQYERAQRAVKEKNWRQAVHYLSIAAAIHPDNEQVREQLKTARAEKRKQEVGA